MTFTSKLWLPIACAAALGWAFSRIPHAEESAIDPSAELSEAFGAEARLHRTFGAWLGGERPATAGRGEPSRGLRTAQFEHGLIGMKDDGTVARLAIERDGRQHAIVGATALRVLIRAIDMLGEPRKISSNDQRVVIEFDHGYFTYLADGALGLVESREDRMLSRLESVLSPVLGRRVGAWSEVVGQFGAEGAGRRFERGRLVLAPGAERINYLAVDVGGRVVSIDDRRALELLRYELPRARTVHAVRETRETIIFEADRADLVWSKVRRELDVVPRQRTAGVPSTRELASDLSGDDEARAQAAPRAYDERSRP